MARIRTIKPEFPHSESMGNVSRDARLAFVLLWTLADDSGRLRGNSRMLASLLFPYDDDAPKKIDGWLGELEEESCIVRYVIDGSSYVEIRNWLNHQKIDKPSLSKIPPPSDDSRGLAKAREDSSLDRIKEGTKDQGKEGTKDSSAEGSAESVRDESDLIREVFDHYRTYHPRAHPDPQSKSKEWKQIKARLKEGHSVEDLKLAIDGCHRSAWHQGENDRATKYDSLELIVRDSSKVAQFMELANGPTGTGVARTSSGTPSLFSREQQREQEQLGVIADWASKRTVSGS